MQTEPIGFKGIFGECMATGYGDCIVSTPTKDGKNNGNIVCLAPSEWVASMDKWEANEKILAASKKMAIALQRIVKLISHLQNHTSAELTCDTIAKEALKEAGL